jgi:hypothetical protein
VSHFAGGGGPEQLLGGLLKAAGLGAAVGLVTGGATATFVKMGAKHAAAATFKAAAMGFKAANLTFAAGRSVFAGYAGMTLSKAFWFPIPGLGWFLASPQKSIGIPAWSFSGTWPGVRGGANGGGESDLLQTMLLGP